jgi:uncharacterized protein YjbJ (UPF0337 family)
MNWHQIRGRLVQWSGVLKEAWGAAVHNERLERAGRRDRALGEIEYRHGRIRAAIARQQRHLAQHIR